VEKDFTVYENNKKKPLTYFMHDFGAPLSLTVLLDVSGSMALENKLGECKAALRHLATKLLRPRDEIALLIFADGQVEVAAKHSADKEEFLRELDKTEAYGQTALNDAVAVSPEFATRAKNEKRALLLLTDGIENDSQSTPEQALEIARRVDVPIYTIGYKIPRSEQMLQAHKRSAGLTAAGIVATLDKFSAATGGKGSTFSSAAVADAPGDFTLGADTRFSTTGTATPPHRIIASAIANTTSSLASRIGVLLSPHACCPGGPRKPLLGADLDVPGGSPFAPSRQSAA
jgi:VWFA-related protein